MKYKIYKLIFDNKVIYVGRTIMDLERRKSRKYKFIPFHRSCNIELIEETYDVSRERHWIQYYKDLGFELLNKYKGDGLDVKEYRDSHKEIMKEYRNKNKDEYIKYQKEYRKRKKEKLNDLF